MVHGTFVTIQLVIILSAASLVHSQAEVVFDNQCQFQRIPYLKLPNPHDCRTYFECNEEMNMVYKMCDRDQGFDPEIGECSGEITCNVHWNTDRSVSTYNKQTVPKFPVTPVVDRASTCANQPDGYTYKTSDAQCNTYTMCWRGVGHSVQCPSGFSYNYNATTERSSSVCDISNNYRCNTSDASLLCPPTGIHAFRTVDNCSEYNYCFSGVHQVKICPTGLHFDGRHQQCVPMDMAQCFDCPVRDDPLKLVTFAIKDEPNAYYVCLNSKVVKFNCYTGLQWNQETQHCEIK